MVGCGRGGHMECGKLFGSIGRSLLLILNSILKPGEEEFENQTGSGFWIHCQTPGMVLLFSGIFLFYDFRLADRFPGQQMVWESWE